MRIKLPRIIEKYVDSSNKHDVKSILACFSDTAIVHDEGRTHNGKAAIEDWVVKTIGKYKFQFNPLAAEDAEADVAVSMEVSGTFDGSPVTLEYHFAIENDKISGLKIE